MVNVTNRSDKFISHMKGGVSGMAWHKLLIEMGMGVDQHGQSPTHACQKAILDAVHRVCMPSLVEGGLLSSCKVKLTIDLGVPGAGTWI